MRVSIGHPNLPKGRHSIIVRYKIGPGTHQEASCPLSLTPSFRKVLGAPRSRSRKPFLRVSILPPFQPVPPDKELIFLRERPLAMVLLLVGYVITDPI